MIEVTLKFNSIAEMLTHFGGPSSLAALSTAAVVAAPATEKPAPKPKAEKAAATAAPASAAPSSPTVEATPPAAAPEKSAPPADKPVEYATLQKAVFDAVGKCRAAGLDPAEHVLSVARNLGYDNFKAMSEDPAGVAKYARALAAVRALTFEAEGA